MDKDKLFRQFVKNQISEREYKSELAHLQFTEHMKVGKRVLCNSNYEGAQIKGKYGTIKSIEHQTIVVEFDEPFESGYTCGGTCKNRHGWRVNYSQLTVIDTEGKANG